MKSWNPPQPPQNIVMINRISQRILTVVNPRCRISRVKIKDGFMICEEGHTWSAEGQKSDDCPFCYPHARRLSEFDVVGQASGHYNADDLIALEESHAELLGIVLEEFPVSEKKAIDRAYAIRKKVGLK